MKSILVAIIFLTVWAAHAQVWVDEPTRTVTVNPTPGLTAALVEVEDPQAWAVLDLHWEYSIRLFKKELDEYRTRYPGYTVKRAIRPTMDKEIEVQLPGVARTFSVHPRPGVEGPFFTLTIILSKEEFESLKAIDRWQEKIVLKGRQVVPVKKSVVDQKVSFDPMVCDSLAGGGKQAKDILPSLIELMSGEKRQGAFRTDDFQKKVIEELLEACFQINSRWSVRVRTLRDLLAIELQPQRLNRPLEVVEYKLTEFREELPLSYKWTEEL